MVRVQPARGPLVGGRLERRQAVEAEPLRVVEDRPRADRLADVAEDRVDRVLEALEEAHVAERLRRLGVARVAHPLPVLLAVAGVVEARVGAEGAGVESGGGRDDLEGRAGGEEPLGRAVQQRRRRAPAGVGRAQDPPEVPLDEVLVVRRARGHHADGAGAGVEGDDRAAPPAQVVHRDLLGAQAGGQHEVVAGHGRPPDAVDRGVEERAEVRVRAGQVVVLGPLEPRLRATLRRVADRLREEPVVRVAPVEEGLAADPPADVPREPVAVPREDQAAPDLELRDALDRVVLPVLEPRDRPGLPVGGRDDEGRDEPDRGDGEPDDLAVHAASPRAVFARCETRSSPASRTKLATTLDPP